MTAAFQSSAFQNNAFQVGGVTPTPPAPSGGYDFGTWYEAHRARRKREEAILEAAEAIAEPILDALPEEQQDNALERLDALVAQYRPTVDADFSALAAEQDAEIQRAAQLIVAKWRKEYIRRQDEEVMFLLMH